MFMPYNNASATDHITECWSNLPDLFKTEKQQSTDNLTSRLVMDLMVLNGDSNPLRVDSNATVRQLKELISRDFGVSPPQQKLSANNGHRIDLEDDSKTLRSYGLHPGSKGMLIITNPRPFRVFVKNEKGSTGTYEVAIDETVDQLKRKVFNKERVPVDQQRLIYNGRQLESGKKLQEYDITSESTIHMTLRLRGG